MEPGARAAEEVTQESARFRWRLAAACLLLTGLCLIQSPGLLVPDTKLDLAVEPLDFLGRAAHLWDPEGAFGQLQNQAYGYLWPMGPFFALGHVLDVPGWVVQRLWLALVVCVAFLGGAKLSRALGVRSDLACLVAGFAFALSPRMLTVLGPSSIEVWPSALAPWVLLPLVKGSRSGSPRRAAALAALAVAMVGGVNAAATAAVLPLGVLWLLTRERGARRRSLMIWWPIFTLLGTLWWLGPLFLLGRYSPPFLDFIETASVTTYPTTLADALRGTSNWVPYVDQAARAGGDLISAAYLPMNSAVLLAAGLAGLALRRNPHRVFLLTGVAVGLALVGMGHLGAVQGWFAPELRQLLDGALAPLRNVHKFDPVVRLPLVVGLAFAVDELHERWATAPRTRHRGPGVSERTSAAMVIGVVVIAVLGSVSPALAGRVTPGGGFTELPRYWQETAAYLHDEQDEHPGVALLVPGSSFATYVWGSPRDEPLQVLADSPWAVRNAVPLTPAGNIRMLDEIERRLTQGQGGAGLAAYLQRAGISHVVVRNDLERDSDIADPVMVHQALDGTPGLDRVASFGPDIGGRARIEGDFGKTLVNSGWQAEYPAVEVYRLADGASYATAVDEPTVVVGGPEDLAGLADAGVVGTSAVTLAADRDQGQEPPARVVLTDGLRGVARNFGRLHDSVSPTLTAQAWDARAARGTLDYELPGGSRWLTLARLEGAVAVSASSSQSDPRTLGSTEPGLMPEAAVDGNPDTHWRSAAYSGDAHWWRIDLDRPRTLGRVSVRVGDAGEEVLSVSTPDWTSEPLRFDPGETRTIQVPGEPSSLTVTDVSGRQGNQLELAEVDLGRPVVRRLMMPDVPDGWGAPEAIVVRRLGDARRGCATVDGEVRCADHKAVAEEEPLDVHRGFTSPTFRLMPADLTVVPRGGSALDEIVLRGQPVFVKASTSDVDDPRAGVVAAVDGDPGTTWTASSGEVNPQIRVSWLGTRVVSGLGMSVADETAARLPERLELSWPGGRRVVELSDGSARFAPIRTSQLTIRVVDAEPANDLGFDGGARQVPVGISELLLTGVPYLPLNLSDDPAPTRCGEGPTIRNNGVSHRTRVIASPAALHAGEPVEARLCRGPVVPVSAGPNALDLLGTDAFVPERLVLGDVPSTVAPRAGALPADSTSAVRRRIEADPHTELATRENANPGWRAVADGRAASPVVLDGWRQGWLVPRSGLVDMTFAPDRDYRVALCLGGVALVGLILLMAPWSRRRREWPEVGARRSRGAVVVCVVALVGGVLAGTAGVVVSLLGLGLSVLLRRASPVSGAWWVGAPLLASYGAYVVRPWGTSSQWAGQLAWPHLAVVFSLATAAGWVVLDQRIRTGASRRAGRSTRR